MRESRGMTNEQVAREDKLFLRCCKLAGILPTKRQASKWRNGKGLARRFISQASLEQEIGLMKAMAANA